MSKATFAFGRFNPPTEKGHGRLISAVQSHAETTGGTHYIFPSHKQDKTHNPLSHSDKVTAMKKLFPTANIVSHPDVRNAIDALKHLEKKGHTHVTAIVGSDRVKEFHRVMSSYNGKEFNFKKLEVKSAGERDAKSKGVAGVSASKLRNFVAQGKRDKFISHYTDKKLGAEIHDKVKKAMNESRKAMFIIGGPGSGKDYVINNILNRFNMVEVQIDQILNGFSKPLIESGVNLLINSNADLDKIQLVKGILNEYEFSHTIVSVTNKVSRERNEARGKPLNEQIRIRKWLDAESAPNKLTNSFTFKNSLDMPQASPSELKTFQNQIEDYLGFLYEHNYMMDEHVRIYAPEHPNVHGKEARIFHRHNDGRINVQVNMGHKNVRNYTLNIDQYRKIDEVLEYGTDAATDHYKRGTPGQNSPVDNKPKLSLKRMIRNRKKLPPKEFDSRVGGVTPFDGVGSYSGGALSGLATFANEYIPPGKSIQEMSKQLFKKKMTKKSNTPLARKRRTIAKLKDELADYKRASLKNQWDKETGRI